MIFWICWLIVVPFVLILFPTKVCGRKYLKMTKKQATIYCANHQTNNDAVILKAKVMPRAKIMAKKSLFKFKPFGWLLKKFGAYPVDRGGNDISSVKYTLKILKENKKLLLFPEGTRIKNADAIDIKNGAVMFALKTDSYVVPTYFRKITMPFVFNKYLIGKPFKFSDMEEFKDKKIDKELLDKASEYLVSKMKELKEIDYKEYKKQYKNYKKELKNLSNVNSKQENIA